jgi:hypothetical protein
VSKCYLTMTENGALRITSLTGESGKGESWELAKTLFELSRETDMDTHFSPAIHTLKTIASGLQGHRPLELCGECDHTELPSSRYFRDAWEWSQ